jgi:hypothetical protein
MKSNRTIFTLLALLALAFMTLSACGSAATPTPAPAAPTATTAPVSATTSASSVELTVSGAVSNPLSLTDAELHAMKQTTVSAIPPKQTAAVSYSGVLFSDLMAQAQVTSSATSLVMTGSDGYSATIDLPTLQACTTCMVAFSSTPGSLYAVMPGQPGKVWVSNLITLQFK